MTEQIEKKGRSLVNNLPIQMVILAIVAAVLIVLAAKYIW
jgi:hypothetical protein